MNAFMFFQYRTVAPFGLLSFGLPWIDPQAREVCVIVLLQG